MSGNGAQLIINLVRNRRLSPASGARLLEMRRDVRRCREQKSLLTSLMGYLFG